MLATSGQRLVIMLHPAVKLCSADYAIAGSFWYHADTQKRSCSFPQLNLYLSSTIASSSVSFPLSKGPPLYCTPSGTEPTWARQLTPWHSVSPVNHPPVYILYMQGRSIHVPCCVYCFSGTQQPNGKIWNPPCNDDAAMEWNTSLLILSLMTKTVMLKQRQRPLNVVGMCFETDGIKKESCFSVRSSRDIHHSKKLGSPPIPWFHHLIHF